MSYNPSKLLLKRYITYKVFALFNHESQCAHSEEMAKLFTEYILERCSFLSNYFPTLSPYPFFSQVHFHSLKQNDILVVLLNLPAVLLVKLFKIDSEDILKSVIVFLDDNTLSHLERLDAAFRYIYSLPIGSHFYKGGEGTAFSILEEFDSYDVFKAKYVDRFNKTGGCFDVY